MPGNTFKGNSGEPSILLCLGALALAVSGISPKDPFTWFMEVAPALAAAPVLIATYRKFPLTPLLYRLIFLHSLILMWGGHYTYAEVPLGFWMQEAFGFARNDYDKIGHFAQGFVPALAAREIFVRHKVIGSGAWRFFLVACVCLAFSAFYEFIEWWTALAAGQGAEAFLGTQGDPWDTQSDMFTALVGAILAQVAFAGVQDRQMGELVDADELADRA